MKALLDQIIQLISIMTGLTQAQLLGMATGSESATEASIASGGQSIRLNDMSKEISRFTSSQSTKLWKIIQQFVDFEKLNVIVGESGMDQQTGMPIYTWLNPDPSEEDVLRTADLRMLVEVGSTQKLDYAYVRKSIENFINILARTDVVALLQQQGKKLDLGEIIKMWLDTTPEVYRDTQKIIQDVNTNTQGLLSDGMLQAQLAGGQQGGATEGSKTNELRSMLGQTQQNPNQAARQL
jgi:hypothetical protein